MANLSVRHSVDSRAMRKERGSPLFSRRETMSEASPWSAACAPLCGGRKSSAVALGAPCAQRSIPAGCQSSACSPTGGRSSARTRTRQRHVELRPCHPTSAVKNRALMAAGPSFFASSSSKAAERRAARLAIGAVAIALCSRYMCEAAPSQPRNWGRPDVLMTQLGGKIHRH
jgi:hypothetical protein